MVNIGKQEYMAANTYDHNIFIDKAHASHQSVKETHRATNDNVRVLQMGISTTDIVRKAYDFFNARASRDN